MYRIIMNNIKIRERLIIVNISIVLLITVISVPAFFYVARAYDEMLNDASSKYLEQSTYRLDDEIRKLETYSYNLLADKDTQRVMYNIKTAPTTYAQNKQIELLFESISFYTAADYNISCSYFIDTKGEYFFDGINPISIDENVLRLITEKSNEAKGEFVILDNTAERGYIYGARLVRQIEDLTLDSLGIIAFRLELDYVVKAYLEQTDFFDSELFIFSPEANLLYKGNDVDVQPIREFITGNTKGYTIVQVEDDRYFCSFTTSEYTGWKYVNLVSYDEAFERRGVLRNIIFLAVGMTFIIAVYFSINAASNITKPIQALTNRMKKVESGNFTSDPIPFEYEKRGDEVGLLYKDFEIMIQRINTLIEEDYKKQIIIKDTSLKALQSQINPHFLYNTLESINWLAKVNDEVEISTMTESLGKLMRNAVDTKNMMITIDEELELLGSYIKIQKVRFEERLIFTNHIGVKFRGYKIPKLTFQPIVENAINYGLENMLEPCRITIEADDDGKSTVIIISDNGPGMSQEMVQLINSNSDFESKRGTGIGIMNINRRLKMVFGESYGLSVESEIGIGTKVYIRIPLLRMDDHV